MKVSTYRKATHGEYSSKVKLFHEKYNNLSRECLDASYRIRDDFVDLEVVPDMINAIISHTNASNLTEQQMHRMLYPCIEYFLIKFRSVHDHISAYLIESSKAPSELRKKAESNFIVLYLDLFKPKSTGTRQEVYRNAFSENALNLIESIFEGYLREFNLIRNNIIHCADNIEVLTIKNDEIWFQIKDAESQEEKEMLSKHTDRFESHRINFSMLYATEMKNLTRTLNSLQDFRDEP